MHCWITGVSLLNTFLSGPLVINIVVSLLFVVSLSVISICHTILPICKVKRLQVYVIETKLPLLFFDVNNFELNLGKLVCFNVSLAISLICNLVGGQGMQHESIEESLQVQGGFQVRVRFSGEGRFPGAGQVFRRG